MSAADDDEVEVRRRIKAMREDDLVEFIRETVVQLQTLADRLERHVPEGSINQGDNHREGTA